MHIFEMISYPPLASLTKILQASVIQKKKKKPDIPTCKMGGGIFSVLIFFSLKRYFDDAIQYSLRVLIFD